jgi:hypothetical protein
MCWRLWDWRWRTGRAWIGLGIGSAIWHSASILCYKNQRGSEF